MIKRVQNQLHTSFCIALVCNALLNMRNLPHGFIIFDILLHIKTEPKLIKKTFLFNLIF